MVQIGYTISSEEFRPNELVEHAVKAEKAGFPFASISDHYHPWIDSQGHSAFVWSVLGGIASQTSSIKVMTGVTAPIIRIHPAIIAQAAATVADMMPGRFMFGVGTGEALNEHITGEVWPPISIRQEMLAEAVDIIRQLWEGGYQTIQGDYYDVHNARIYTLPDELPPILVAASGPSSAEVAGTIGDGLISTSPSAAAAEAFDTAGGTGKPRFGQVHAVWAEDEDDAAQTAMKYWGHDVLGGQINQELALPKYFQEASEGVVTPELIKQSIVCGPDAAKFHEKIKAYTDAGFDHVYLHQIGPDQDGFIEFAKRELLPQYE